MSKRDDIVRHTPEVVLWRNVLLRAVEDLSMTSKYHRKRADKWIRSKREDIGSFIWVADVLGLDHFILRERIYERHRAKDQVGLRGSGGDAVPEE